MMRPSDSERRRFSGPALPNSNSKFNSRARADEFKNLNSRYSALTHSNANHSRTFVRSQYRRVCIQCICICAHSNNRKCLSRCLWFNQFPSLLCLICIYTIEWSVYISYWQRLCVSVHNVKEKYNVSIFKYKVFSSIGLYICLKI